MARSSLRLSPLEWLCLLGGLLLVMQYAWLMDDAFVYFRYVDNAVCANIGLVYNLGEYVEGFTSPFWALLLLPLRALGLGYWTIVRVVGLLAFAATWLALVLVNRRLTPAGARTVAMPLGYLVGCYGLMANFTSGLETPLVLAAAAAYGLFACQPRSKALAVILAWTPLVRPELAAPLLVALGWAWWEARRFPWRLALWSLALQLAWLSFRVVYYADLLPNTWYLKNVTDWGQGLRYLLDTAIPYRLYVLVPAVGVLVWLWWHRQQSTSRATAARATAARATAKRATATRGSARFTAPEPAGTFSPSLALAPRLVMLACAAVVLVHVVRVGGDHRHFRFVAFPFLLGIASLSGIAERWLAGLTWRGQPLSTAALRWSALALGLAACALSGTGYPAQLTRHPLLGQGEHHIVNKIEDRAIHRYHKDLSLPPWGSGAKIEARAAYEALGRSDAVRYRGIGLSLWCVSLYHEADERAVHLLGLTEPILARIDVPADRPSHKLALQPLGQDIGRILRRYKVAGIPEPGLFERAVREGVAPAWIAENLQRISVIERKEFNRHHPRENLRLAFAHVGRLHVALPASATGLRAPSGLPPVGSAAARADSLTPRSDFPADSLAHPSAPAPAHAR